jgi:Rieske Fe-S protein
MNPPDVPEAAVNEVPAGTVSDLKPNSAKIIRFGSRPVLLIRSSDTEWRAFSAVCTHLNCTVQYQAAERQIWCACHNGLYDLSGRVLAGPPPRPLEEYAVRIRGEEVIVARRA